MKKITLTLLLVFTIAGLSAQNIVYVDGNLTTGTSDGSSWANAIRAGRMLQLAANAAVNGDSIKIASGSLSDDAQITINKAVTIVGGYDSSTGNRTGMTTLTGASTVRRLVIDGGALAMSFHNLIVADGGAAHGSGALIQAGTTPVFNNVQFLNNAAGANSGGAVYISAGATPEFKNVVFSGNSGANGGAVYVDASSSATMSYTNTLFANNSATGRGGALDSNSTAVLNFTNCTFYGNTGVNGGGIFLGASSGAVTIHNTVFYDNDNSGTGNPQSVNTADFTALAGSYVFADEGGASVFATEFTNYTSLAADPFENSADPDGADNVFATIDDGMYPDSSGVLMNAGDDAQNSETLDAVRESRKVGIIDIGAYEYSATLDAADLELGEEVAIYPNPVQGVLHVNGGGNEIEKIEIYTLLGKLVLRAEGQSSVNVSSLASGVYVAKINQDGGHISVRQFVKR